MTWKADQWQENNEDKNLYRVWLDILRQWGRNFRKTEEHPKETDGNTIIDIEEGMQLEEGWENFILAFDDNETDNDVNKNIDISKKTNVENFQTVSV